LAHNDTISKEQIPLVLSTREVAEILGISLPFCYELFRSEDFPSFRIAKRWLVKREALFDWIDNQTQRNKDDFIRKV
jgi:excisionase family DNA binding protein